MNCFVHFCNVFGLVDHNILLERLQQTSVLKLLYKWFELFFYTKGAKVNALQAFHAHNGFSGMEACHNGHSLVLSHSLCT